MHVTVNVKSDTWTVPGTTNTKYATVTLDSASLQDVSGHLVVDNVTTVSMELAGATGIADLDSYYEKNGSYSLMASGIAAATLAAFTLF